MFLKFIANQRVACLLSLLKSLVSCYEVQLRIKLSIPVTVATAEGSFSNSKLIKIFNRPTMEDAIINFNYAANLFGDSNTVEHRQPCQYLDSNKARNFF